MGLYEVPHTKNVMAITKKRLLPPRANLPDDLLHGQPPFLRKLDAKRGPPWGENVHGTALVAHSNYLSF
jgi:hypothetical protein